jgi:hypothetical protein
MAMKDRYESRTRRIRRALLRRGLAFRQSPTKRRDAAEFGKFHIIDLETDTVVHGKAFDLTLDQVEAFAFPEEG